MPDGAVMRGCLCLLFALGAVACAQSERHLAPAPGDGAPLVKTEPHVTYLEAGAYRQRADGMSGFVVGNANDQGVNLTRLAASGAVDWTLSFGTGTDSYTSLGGIALDGDGNVYVAGSFDGTLAVADRTLESTVNPSDDVDHLFDDPHGMPSQDAFVLKLTRAGKVAWLERFGGIADQRGVGLAYAPDGSLAVAIAYSGRLELGAHTYLSQGGASGTDLLFARLDLDGAPLAARSYFLRVRELAELVFDREGALLVAGFTAYGEMDTSFGPLPDSGWVAKLDPNFDPLWFVPTDGQKGPSVRAIATDSQANVVLVTDGYDATGFFGSEIEEQGIGMAKLDRDGELLFTRSFGSISLDHASGVSVLSNDDIAVAGSYYRTVDFGGGPYENDSEQNEGDPFVARFDANGEYLSSLDLAAPGADYAGRLTALPDDTLVLTGSTWSGPGLDIPHQGTGRTFVAWLGTLL